MISTRNEILKFILPSVLIIIALITAGCAAGLGNQDTTLSEENGSSADEHADNEGDTHGDEGGEEHDHEDEHAADEGDTHDHEGEDEHDHQDESAAEMLALPALTTADLDGEPLRVVASTSIIGDVVGQIGGDAIELTTLIGFGQDPHSFDPTPQDLTIVPQANVIFINGWDLEEGLVHDLEEIAEGVPIVPISANIVPLAIGEDEFGHEEEGEEHEGEHEEHEADEEEHHQHSGADPHVWFSIHNVEQWAENVERVLSALDPANAGTYESNAASYLSELESLEDYAESKLAQIPEEKRLLVTNHDSFSYFARDYGFEIIGTILPAASTLADPSAGDLAKLIEEMEAHKLCTIFTETSISDNLAQTVASELEGCSAVKILPLYTGSIGIPGSGADSYIGMYRANTDAIVSGLTD